MPDSILAIAALRMKNCRLESSALIPTDRIHQRRENSMPHSRAQADPLTESDASGPAPWLLYCFVVICLSTHFTLAVLSSRSKSLTFDEVAHLMGGLTYWEFDDYRLNPENGNLSQRIVALPVFLFCDYKMPGRDESTWAEANVWSLSDKFLHHMGNDTERLTFFGRCGTAFVSAALCLVIFLWSQRIFGWIGGSVSLFVATFSPTLLAHGRLMTSDTCLTFFFLAATLAVWELLRCVTPLRIVLGCVFVGALFVTKLSAVLIVPVTGLMLTYSLIRPGTTRIVVVREVIAKSRISRAGWAAACAGIIGIAAWMAVWASCSFRYEANADGKPSTKFWRDEYVLVDEVPGFVGSVLRWCDSSRSLPEAWTYGATFVVEHAHARWAYLNGEIRKTGWWYFFPYTVLVKTPIPVFLLLFGGLAGIWCVLRKPKAMVRLEDCVPLIAILVVMWPFLMSSHLNIGHRHALVTYPVIFILIGANAGWIAQAPWRKALGVLLLLMGSHFVASVWSYPHYLAYFNSIVQPRNAWRHLVDSSLDWGQDLPALRDWVAENAPDTVYLDYFGRADPVAYGIEYEPMAEDYEGNAIGLFRAGAYCISATNMHGVYKQLRGDWSAREDQAYAVVMQQFREYQMMDPQQRMDLERSRDPDLIETIRRFNLIRTYRLREWLKRREPDAMAGFSILIYRLSDADLNDAFSKPMPPAE